MRPLFRSIAEGLMERTAEELIAGVFLALLLALAAGGAHTLARRKVKDTAMLVTILGLVANLVGIVLAAAYIRMDVHRPAPAPSAGARGGEARLRPTIGQIQSLAAEAIARGVFEAADSDRDGRLSADEAAAASTRYLRAAEARAGRPVDRDVIAAEVRDLARPATESPSPAAQADRRGSPPEDRAGGTPREPILPR
jgi:hypothetical protein